MLDLQSEKALRRERGECDARPIFCPRRRSLNSPGRRLHRGMAKVKRGKLDRTADAEFCHRLLIECVTPELDAGRYPVKRIVGDMCEIGADIIKDGHDLLAGHVRYRVPNDDGWRFTSLTY